MKKLDLRGLRIRIWRADNDLPCMAKMASAPGGYCLTPGWWRVGDALPSCDDHLRDFIAEMGGSYEAARASALKDGAPGPIPNDIERMPWEMRPRAKAPWRPWKENDDDATPPDRDSSRPDA